MDGAGDLYPHVIHLLYFFILYALFWRPILVGESRRIWKKNRNYPQMTQSHISDPYFHFHYSYNYPYRLCPKRLVRCLSLISWHLNKWEALPKVFSLKLRPIFLLIILNLNFWVPSTNDLKLLAHKVFNKLKWMILFHNPLYKK